MTRALERVLVIGGGFSGMSAAIQLRKIGVHVELVEIDPDWRNYGAGITIAGPAFRAFETLGVIERYFAEGAASDDVDFFAPDGTYLMRLPTPHAVGTDYPGNGGIMRPVLAKILADATRASGTEVRLGCTFTAIKQHDDHVAVDFTDGSSKIYDLVIGADGLYSKTRETIFPDAPKPAYSGQCVWRAVLPRPAEVERCFFYVGPKVKMGINPVSRNQMYMFINEDRAVNEYIDPARFVGMVKDILAEFPAPMVQWIREQLNDDSQVIVRPLEGLLLPQPWNSGRIVLIGDAVHATTPHLAAGACIGIEDAIVLAEELSRADVETALDRFQARRWERCRMVVENSARLGEIEATGGDKQEHARIMRESAIALAEPI